MTPVLPPPAGSPPPGAAHPSGTRRITIAVAATVVVSVLLIGGIVLWRTGDEATPSRGAAATEATEPTPELVDVGPPALTTPIAPTGDAAFDAGVTEVARFVEQTRGHAFKDPVRVELVDDATFNDRLLADFDEGVGQLHRTEVALKALGIVSTDTDLVAEVRRILSVGVIGFYDPKSKALVVRGTDLTAFTRQTLAHELTHALDDQWFDLDRPELDKADDETSFGFQALTEGSATWVGDAWKKASSPSERAEAAVEARAFSEQASAADLPAALVQIIQSPYSVGLDFVDALVANGGTSALDAAFRSPPVSSEQVLHPDRYRSGEAPVSVPVPPSDADQVDEGVIGELSLIQVLRTSIAPATARQAGEGWGGDRYVVWRTAEGRSCLRGDLVTDSAADQTELETALRQWAARQPAATIETPSAGTLRLTSCR